MKKTTQQKKELAITYLTKVSNHLFLTNDGETFKIQKNSDGFSKVKNGVETPIDTNYWFSVYENDPKGILKSILFYKGHKMVNISKKVKIDKT